MKSIGTLAFVLLLSVCVFSQKTEEERSWNQPVEPFNIIGNIYYVGASDVTSYLITTPKGHILIDSGFYETVPQIKQNIVKLGFKLEDVKILLNSHAHSDHAGGLAELKRLTHAKLYASHEDAQLLARGGKGDPNFLDRFTYEPVKADKFLTDGEDVRLNGEVMTANITPGHTKGCTTWTTTATENGHTYNVIFVCSTTAPGYKLVGNAGYPEIVADYSRTFECLKRMHPDVFLASHANFYDLAEKLERKRKGERPNPFIDPAGYAKFIEETEAAFLAKLKEQQKPPE